MEAWIGKCVYMAAVWLLDRDIWVEICFEAVSGSEHEMCVLTFSPACSVHALCMLCASSDIQLQAWCFT